MNAPIGFSRQRRKFLAQCAFEIAPAMLALPVCSRSAFSEEAGAKDHARPSNPKDEVELGKQWFGLSKKAAAEVTRRHIHGLVRAAHLYWEQHGAFPPAVIANSKLPAGKRLSGFVLLLPYLNAESWIEKGEACFEPAVVELANSMYKAIDQTKAWDDPVNLPAAKTVLHPFLSPHSGDFRDEQGYAVSHFAFVQGSAEGADGAFPGTEGVKLAEITDGTSTTLALGQIVNELGPWMAEGVATARQVYAPTDQLAGSFGSKYKSGAFFAMCDSSPLFVNFDERSLNGLQKAATRAAGELYELERISNPFQNEKDR